MEPTSRIPAGFAAPAAATFSVHAPIRVSVADDKIVDSFRESYIYRTYLNEDDVKIASRDGVVTLTGTVADVFRRTLAHDTAANLPGVLRVESELVTKAEVATENADKWISRKVMFALLLHRNVSARTTTVEVDGGVVTLTGVADSLAQKELTTEYAADIDNVISVHNQMTVAVQPQPGERTAGEKLDDASVTAQVKIALYTHRSTNSVKTTVDTRDGKVTITGIARNAAEKALVTKLATDMHGVESVKNEMTIEVAKTK